VTRVIAVFSLIALTVLASPAALRADEPVVLGAATNGVRIGISVKMIQVNSAWHPMLHVVVANVSNESKEFFPVTTWQNIIAIADSAGALVAMGYPCPNGEIPGKPQNFLLAPGAVRTEDIPFDLTCFMKKPGSYSVTLTSDFFFPTRDVGYSSQISTVVKSNTTTVVMP
jgi:hypothetical protein